MLNAVITILLGFAPLSIKNLTRQIAVVVFPEPAHAIIFKFLSISALIILSYSALSKISFI